MRAVIAISLLAMLAACQAEETPAEPAANATSTGTMPSPTPDTPTAMVSPVDVAAATRSEEDKCGASKLDRWLNVLPTDAVKEEIAHTVGERVIRYFGPNDKLTMDFSEERLNVESGEDGRIKRFHCG